MRCFDAKIPAEVTADVMGIRTVKVLMDHYREIGADRVRAALSVLPPLLP